MNALSRFRSWLGSVEFAVTATAVAAALALGLLASTRVAVEEDVFAVVLLAGVSVPNVYTDSWEAVVDTRLAGVAWALVACVLAVACYLLVATGVRSVAGEPVGTVVGLVGTWLGGLLASRALTN